MLAILLFYGLMASTFTLAKIAVFYMSPFFFIGIRMVLAGILLLGYLYFCKRSSLHVRSLDYSLFAQIIIFHIYGAYIFEFWGLQYVTSSKACLLYNLAPFITALLCYFLFKERLTRLQIVALIIGFLGMLPLLISHAQLEDIVGGIGFLSLPELSLLLAVFCTAYGWIIMKQLVDRHYNVLFINGIGMFFGGIAALITSFIFEPLYLILRINVITQPGGLVSLPLGFYTPVWMMVLFCMILLILIANIIGYNWYASLLKQYSPTFLSLFGLCTPLFAALYGWLFLNEEISWPFILSVIITAGAVYLFYKQRTRTETLIHDSN